MPYLQFKGKIAVENYHHTIPHHTIEFDEALSVLPEGATPSLDDNLIIEGDNLLALKALLPTHAGQIKCIYIDPPYNRGAEEWVYNDNLTAPQFKEWIGKTVGKDGEDFLRHDKWCCMIYPRVQLLKELLSADGVLFVSIDEVEVDNLRLILNEVFRVDWPLATFAWKSRASEDTRAKTGVSMDHEYILCYGRSANASLRGAEKLLSKFSNPDSDKRGPWRSADMTGLATADRRPNLHYCIIDWNNGGRYDCPPKGWRFDAQTLAKKVAEKRVLFPPSGVGRPRQKLFQFEMKSQYKNISSVITFATTADGTREVNEILGSGAFDFPKPTELIKALVVQATDENDLILDSTAGSGTTGHAVLSLNSEVGDRRFVLIQQPHDTTEDKDAHRNICADITRERVARVISGYSRDNSRGGTVETPGLGGSFTYARISAEPLFGQYRELGSRLPGYDEIAKYIFYTETSVEWQPDAANLESGYIGERDGTSYYLLYRPNRQEDWSLDKGFLENTALNDPSRRLVVYCEKVWMHKDDLRRWQQEHGKSVRQMLVPFNLR